jgi:ribokinase
MITIVGSLVMDITIHVPRLVQAGGIVHGQEVQAACGGKGANQATAVARMGGRAALVGIVGVDLFGEAMLSALAANNVDTRAVVRRSDANSGCFIVATDPQGQTQINVSNGINAALSIADVELHRELIASSQAVITQLEINPDAAEAALHMARQAGVPTVLNAAPTFRFRPSMLALADTLIVNAEEAAHLSGAQVVDVRGAVTASGAIKAQGARDVLITLGADGAWVDTDEWQGYVPPYPALEVDALGAGDTFVGAYVTQRSEGVSVRTAAWFATAAAALSVTRVGAQASMPTLGEVNAFMMAVR